MFPVGFCSPSTARQGHVGDAAGQKLLSDSLGSGSGDEMVFAPVVAANGWSRRRPAKAGQDGHRVVSRSSGTAAAFMGNAGSNEFLLRLAKDAATICGGGFPATRLTTPRGEVLAWLSKGKTNIRDIAQILG